MITIINTIIHKIIHTYLTAKLSGGKICLIMPGEVKNSLQADQVEESAGLYLLMSGGLNPISRLSGIKAQPITTL